ncbi:MAG: HPr family phosphocarrier protein [Rhodospirillaceae bacterium]|jgi:phosphocarrier protein HPr|nr:HPr family phosphocarrier protein [Rhodospirillaceae bacterium]
MNVGETVWRTARIVNSKGLHARAAAKLCKVAEKFDAEILVSKGELEVSSDSIMGLLMLAAAQETEIHLSARGADAEKAMDVICKLIADKFDEE